MWKVARFKSESDLADFLNAVERVETASLRIVHQADALLVGPDPWVLFYWQLPI